MNRNIVMYGASPDPGMWPSPKPDQWPPHQQPAASNTINVFATTDPASAAVANVRAARIKVAEADAELRKWATEEEHACEELNGIRRAKALASKQFVEAECAALKAEEELLNMARGDK